MLHQQRGISLVGLIFALAILGFVGICAAKVFPTVVEFQAIKSAIKTAKANGGTPQEMRLAFNKNADANYIESITGKDLFISKDTGDTEISFAYDKKIPLVANVSFLIHYEGTTAANGKMPEALATEDK